MYKTRYVILSKKLDKKKLAVKIPAKWVYEHVPNIHWRNFTVIIANSLYRISYGIQKP